MPVPRVPGHVSSARGTGTDSQTAANRSQSPAVDASCRLLRAMLDRKPSTWRAAAGPRRAGHSSRFSGNKALKRAWRERWDDLLAAAEELDRRRAKSERGPVRRALRAALGTFGFGGGPQGLWGLLIDRYDDLDARSKARVLASCLSSLGPGGQLRLLWRPVTLAFVLGGVVATYLFLRFVIG